MREFNEHGLRFTTAELEAYRPYIGLFSPGAQELFADAVCVKMVKEKSAEIPQRAAVEILEDLRRTNTTGVGNMAYIAGHYPVQQIRTPYMHALALYRQEIIEGLIHTG